MAWMTEGIIVGYDGSPGSELALHWAAREASDRGTTLTVCHAWAPEDLALPIEPPLFDLARRQGEEIVQGAWCTPSRSRAPAACSRCWPPGRLPGCCASTAGPSAWSWSVPGARQARRAAAGSVAWKLAGYGQGRIVIVRGPVGRADGGPGPVVAAVDGSAVSHAVLEFAAEEAAAPRSLRVCAWPTRRQAWAAHARWRKNLPT